jgi:putative SOS response-associated peptidase YedK
MCGRYTLVCIDDLGLRFRIYDPTLGCRSHFNVAPSAMMHVIVRHERTEAVTMKWGLISHLVKNVNTSAYPINARAESLMERPVFSSLLEKNRCLVPASRFYEWKTEGKRTVPFYIHLKKDSLFAIAGLHDVWNDMSGIAHQTYTIITTTPNELIAPLHDRMPAILKREDEERWLSGDPLSRGDLKKILAPYPCQDMTAYPVSSQVNDTGAMDDEWLIRPLTKLWKEFT